MVELENSCKLNFEWIRVEYAVACRCRSRVDVARYRP